MYPAACQLGFELVILQRHVKLFSANETNPAYGELASFANQHHEGQTLYWIRTKDRFECQRMCDRTVICKGISYYEATSWLVCIPCSSALPTSWLVCIPCSSALRDAPH